MSKFTHTHKSGGGEKNSTTRTSTKTNSSNQHPNNIPHQRPYNNRREYIMYLQRTIGNQAVGRLLRSGYLQKKLNIGPANDKYEQEADHIADQVVSMNEPSSDAHQTDSTTSTPFSTLSRKPLVNKITPLQRKPIASEMKLQTKSEEERDAIQGTPLQRQAETTGEDEDLQAKLIQRTCSSCQKEYDSAKLQRRAILSPNLCPTCRTSSLQRKLSNPNSELKYSPFNIQPKSFSQRKEFSAPAPHGIESAVNSTRNGGKALSQNERSYFEPRFGTSFANVRLHTDSNAAHLSRSVNARAFTTGSNIYFGAGEYSPNSIQGKGLMAHELTHTVQQGGQVERGEPIAYLQRKSLIDLETENPSDAEIKTTNQYKNYMNTSLVWQADLRMTELEALSACRIMLNAQEGGKLPGWRMNARKFAWQARRRLGRGVPIVYRKGGNALFDAIKAYGHFPPTPSEMQLLKFNALIATFKERDMILANPIMSDSVSIILGQSYHDNLFQLQMNAIVHNYKTLQGAHSKGDDPANLWGWRNQVQMDNKKGKEGSNPYMAIPKVALESVYKASFSSILPPAVLLALWVKEGKPLKEKEKTENTTINTSKNGISVPAKNEADAKAFARSSIYYQEFGSDHFTAYVKHAGRDNTLDLILSKHDPAFTKAINDMKKQGVLRPDFTTQSVNNELSVQKISNGLYFIRPTPKFYTLSIELNSSYFSFLRKNTFAKFGKKPPSVAFNYAQWNMGTESFEKNLLGDKNITGDKKGQELENQILHTNPGGGQVRRNTIRFAMYIQAYEKLFK
ncbi:MAG: DUF4157 domain-containing protein [Leptospirales bacterium]